MIYLVVELYGNLWNRQEKESGQKNKMLQKLYFNNCFGFFLVSFYLFIYFLFILK